MDESFSQLRSFTPSRLGRDRLAWLFLAMIGVAGVVLAGALLIWVCLGGEIAVDPAVLGP